MYASMLRSCQGVERSRPPSSSNSLVCFASLSRTSSFERARAVDEILSVSSKTGVVLLDATIRFQALACAAARSMAPGHLEYVRFFWQEAPPPPPLCAAKGRCRAGWKRLRLRSTADAPVKLLESGMTSGASMYGTGRGLRRPGPMVVRALAGRRRRRRRIISFFAYPLLYT